MKNFTLRLKLGYMLLFCACLPLLYAFSVPEDSRLFIQDLLNKCYDRNTQNSSLKNVELKVTNTGFCRYRKVFANGKEEFFAFNIRKLKYINYLGNTHEGLLLLNTQNDDVIVQTRRDQNGDIDSMSNQINIPLRNIQVEQLNELAKHFKLISEQKN